MDFDTDDTFLYTYSHRNPTQELSGGLLAEVEDDKYRLGTFRAEPPTDDERGET
jgi:hypothetical protein